MSIIQYQLEKRSTLEILNNKNSRSDKNLEVIPNKSNDKIGDQIIKGRKPIGVKNSLIWKKQIGRETKSKYTQ